MLDEICFARGQGFCSNDLAKDAARDVLRLPTQSGDWIAAPRFGCPPELVVIGGRIRLISPRLAHPMDTQLRQEFHEVQLEGRPPVLIRWNFPRLIYDTYVYLPQIRLAGRAVTL
jgi:hypothetical protein